MPAQRQSNDCIEKSLFFVKQKTAYEIERKQDPEEPKRPARPWSDSDRLPPERGKAQVRSLAQRNRVVRYRNKCECADREWQAKPEQAIAQIVQWSFSSKTRQHKQA